MPRTPAKTASADPRPDIGIPADAALASLDTLMDGRDSGRAQGFLIHLPPGYTGRPAFTLAARRALGGDAHPDLRCLAPDGAGDLIKVGDIREMDMFLGAAPAGGGPAGRVAKTLAVFRAHRLHPSAEAALLKSLEEPSAQTRIVLMTDCPDRLAPTIRSRCLVRRETGHVAAAHAEARAWAHAAGTDPLPDAAALGDALARLRGNPRHAALALHHGLLAWIEDLGGWIAAPAGPPPLPAMTGKAAPGADLVAEIAQAVLAAALSEGSARGRGALWDFSRDLGQTGRGGIDARTRLHCRLTELGRALAG